MPDPVVIKSARQQQKLRLTSKLSKNESTKNGYEKK